MFQAKVSGGDALTAWKSHLVIAEFSGRKRLLQTLPQKGEGIMEKEAEITTEEKLLGFRDLIAELMSYKLALRTLRAEEAQITAKRRTFQKAVSYIENVAIPTALKELGVKVEPATDLKVIKDFL